MTYNRKKKNVFLRQIFVPGTWSNRKIMSNAETAFPRIFLWMKIFCWNTERIFFPSVAVLHVILTPRILMAQIWNLYQTRMLSRGVKDVLPSTKQKKKTKFLVNERFQFWKFKVIVRTPGQVISQEEYLHFE